MVEHRPLVRTGAEPGSHSSLTRIVQRYLIPAFVVTLILFLRDRAFASFSAKVQFSPLIRFGRGSVIKPFAIVQTTGGRVVFGRNCAISSFCCVGSSYADIIAGDNVRIGPHVYISATSRNYRRKDKLIVEQGFADKGVRIGSDVLIGAHSVLVDGCEIGDGAVIGVGSVVTGKIPPYAVVFGVPAKVIYWRR